MTTSLIRAADLFCGAGGTSTGMIKAIKALGYDYDLLAINHWKIAVATHTLNHKRARHKCKNIDELDPNELIPGRVLDILVASPECKDHSNAKGGVPLSDQKRADAWMLQRWIEKLYVRTILIENVREFVKWGPLDAKGRPLKSRRGEYFRLFIAYLEVNYHVEWKILNCANYGDPTTRQRFFLLASRKGLPKFQWPEQTHISPLERAKRRRQPQLFTDELELKRLKPWRTARKHVIDWTLPSRSIFDRGNRPLSINTLMRVFSGMRKHSGLAQIMATGGRDGYMQPRSVDEPVRSVMPNSRLNLVEAKPFVMKLSHTKSSSDYTREVDAPLSTITGLQEHALVDAGVHAVGECPCGVDHTEHPLATLHGQPQAHVINLKGKGKRQSRSVDAPLFSQTTRPHQYLVEPKAVLVNHKGKDGRSRDVDNPTFTQTAGGNHQSLVQSKLHPFIVTNNHGKDGGRKRTHDINQPMPAVTTIDAWSVIEPYLIQFFGERKGQKPRVGSVDKPLWTVTGQRTPALVESKAFLVNYHGDHKGRKDGSKRTKSVDEPLPTQDTSNRYGLVENDAFMLKSYAGSDSASLDQPAPTVTANFEHLALVEYLVTYHGNGRSTPVDVPLGALTGTDRFALVEPTVIRIKGNKPEEDIVGLYIPELQIVLDIRLRMLQPPELAKAQGFPKSYKFTGTREDKVMQIGNAVPCNTARALVSALLTTTLAKRPRKRVQKEEIAA